MARTQARFEDASQAYQSHKMFTGIQKFHRIPWKI